MPHASCLSPHCNMNPALHTHDLTRRFGDFVAVDRLSLSVEQGEIFGLLGPNAAGKSTTTRMLAGILQASEGEASVLGLDLFTQTEQIKRRIGYVAQQFSLYPDLTVTENLEFYAGLYGVSDAMLIKQQLQIYQLEQYAQRFAGHLSGGYQRRLAIACATTHQPELVFLDEPTAGIDPVTRKELWDLFYALAAKGMTLFVTTHYMEEAERCNKLAFLSHGKLAAIGAPEEIRNALHDYNIYSCEAPYHPALTDALLATRGVLLVNQFGSQLRIVTEKTVSIDAIRSLLADYLPADTQPTPAIPSIEDAFMVLTMRDKTT